MLRDPQIGVATVTRAVTGHCTLVNTSRQKPQLDKSVSSPTEQSSGRALPWTLLGVFGVFIVSMAIIPTFANVPVGDDWVYTRSVEILMEEGRLEILDLSVVTLVFQILWGALFSLFDVTFVTTRLSTITIVLISTGAFYALCRDLGISKQRSALGSAVYLFNPLTFSLAFTFMTDPQFTALMVIAMWFYVRGLRPEEVSPQTIVLASIAASLAFLVRQQGILIPFAVGLYLVSARRWRPDTGGFKMAGFVAGIPAVTLVLYYAWLLIFHGAPEQQGAFVDEMVAAGIDESRILVSRLIYIEAAYIGMFVLPIAVGAIPALRHYRPTKNRWAISIIGIWSTILISGALIFAGRGRYMPYIPQYAGAHGIGPTDLHGGRPWLLDGSIVKMLTPVFVVASALFIVFTIRRLFDCTVAGRSSASLLCMIGVWQAVGILPPSFHFRNWIISVDRYLLPLVPIVITLLLWSLRDTRLHLPTAWVLTALMAAFSIIGTRDFLTFQEATWEMGMSAVERSIPLTQLDAGASWDGYFLYDFSIEHDIQQRTPGGPWWTNLFGPATDSSYVVSTKVLPGYDVVLEEPYSAWLYTDQQTMYLLQRSEMRLTP